MRASFGKIVLTPPDFLGGYLGRPLAGYTPAPQCRGKYDDIMAHAVLIEETFIGNVKKHMLLVSLDYLKIPLLWTDYVKEKIEDEYQIHPNQVLLHAIHTHKSMDMCGEFVFGGNLQNTIKGIMVGAYHGDDKYKIWAAQQIVKLVGQLLESLRPAEVAWTKELVKDDLIINRRHPLRRSKGNMGVIAFRDSQSKELFGIIANYGAHPTTLANFVDKLSADYPGRVCYKIEELSNGKVQAAFFTAPAGDLNPITTVGNDFEYLAKLPQDDLLAQKGDYDHTKRIGYRLGEIAFGAANEMDDVDFYDIVEFQSFAKTFWVPMKDVTEYKAPFKLQQRLIYLIKRYVLFPVALILGDSEEPNFPGFAVKHKGIFRPSADINVYSQVFYIRWICKKSKGEEVKKLAISGIPGELFEDIADEIYEKTPEGPENTFIFQNANDWISYLFPVKEYMTTGGYEPFASFSPVCGEYVKYAYFRLVKDVQTDIVAGFY